MKAKLKAKFDFETWLSKVDGGKTAVEYAARQKLFTQGDSAHAVFYLRRGKIKLAVLSKQGKEAVLSILGPGSFVGEGCLAGQTVRMATASAVESSSLVRFERETMLRLLHDEPGFSDAFTRYLVTRTIRVEEDLVDLLFNSSEKRLARILLLLAQFGKASEPEPIIPKLSQETLAAMVGTTRPRINHFMTKFRKLGFIEYNDTLEVHSSLLSVILHD
jgi:CRP/FNR family transcriptional regulator, cyclic AMP receptor protein